MLFIYVVDKWPVEPPHGVCPGGSLGGSKMLGKRNSNELIS
jgi:hypothetical protein